MVLHAYSEVMDDDFFGMHHFAMSFRIRHSKKRFSYISNKFGNCNNELI